MRSGLMSSTISSSNKEASTSRSGTSRVAGLRSSSPNMHRSETRMSKDEEVNRKLDYLLKKTRRLEDSMNSLRSENASLVEENKKTQECTVNMWENIKQDRATMSALRDEVSCLRAKIDLVNQKTSLLENSCCKGSRVEDVGQISEQVFSRVHREFSTVVDEVVRACVKEQVEFLSKWTAKGGLAKDALLVEENKSIRSCLSDLEQKHHDLEYSLQAVKQFNKEQAMKQKVMITEASSSAREETQHLLESVTKQMNDTVTFAVEKLKEEISQKYDDSIHQLIESSNNLQIRIAEAESQVSDVDVLVTEVKENSEIEASNLLSILDNTKATVQHLEESLDEVKEEINGREDGRNPPYPLQQDVDNETIFTLKEQINCCEENIKNYLQLFEDHRKDYTETISRLSTAGRQAKSAHIDLADEVKHLSEARKLSDENLANIVNQSEDDRSVISKLSKQNSKLFDAVAECQKSLLTKKNKKKGKDDDVGVDSTCEEEMLELKERMDIFEESVIDTVQEMIDAHQVELLAPVESRLQSLEHNQQKYGELVKESVDTFHSQEVIPIVSNVTKVERMLENLTVKVMQGVSSDRNVTKPGPTPGELSNKSNPLSLSDTPNPFYENRSFSKSSSSSTHAQIHQDHARGTDSGRIQQTVHSDVMDKKNSSPVAQSATHKPKYHPPQTFNLSNTLSDAHEIIPRSGIPNFNSLPDLRKSQSTKNSPQQRKGMDDEHGIPLNNSQDLRHDIEEKFPASTSLQPGQLQVETLLKSLQEKKKKHRKKFQSQVKSEMHVPES